MKRDYWYVILAGILFGFIVFGGQIFVNLGLSLFEISFITQFLAVLILLPFIIANRKLWPEKSRKWLWILFGFANCITLFAQYGALILGVPVAIVVLLLYTQPLWTIIITRLFLKEKINSMKIIACTVVLLGVIFLSNPFHVAGIKSLLGIILALIGGISLSAWVVIGSFVSKNKSSPITTRFTSGLISVFILLLAYPLLVGLIKLPVFVHFSFKFPAIIWIYLIFFTLFVEILSQFSYFKGVKKVPTVDAGIILLLEPVSAALLAFFFLKQPLTFNMIIGGILILFGNYLVIAKSKN